MEINNIIDENQSICYRLFIINFERLSLREIKIKGFKIMLISTILSLLIFTANWKFFIDPDYDNPTVYYNLIFIDVVYSFILTISLFIYCKFYIGHRERLNLS